MPIPIIAPTWRAVRREISTRLDDLIQGLASGGSTTTLTDTGDLDHLVAGSLVGAEISVVNGTGAVQSRHITSHTKTGGTVTLTVPTWVTPNTTSYYEIHKLNGRGFSKEQYDNAMNQAIYALSSSYWTDTFSVPFGIERFGGREDALGFPRFEYPMPSGFLYLYGVDYLAITPQAHNPFGYAETTRALGDATARTRLFQGFKVNVSGWYEWVTVAMAKVGSPTDNLTAAIHTDSSGVPSGTVITNGTSDTVTGSTLDERIRYVPFRFDPPVFLTADTQYHLVFARSTAVNGTNYYTLAEDTGNTYADGTAGTYNATDYTAVSGSDFCFGLFAASTRWRPLPSWEYRRVGTDIIYLPKLPHDSVPIRVRGAAALSAAAVGEFATTSTTEETAITIPPEYMIAYAVYQLISSRGGRNLPDNYNQMAQWATRILDRPRPRRGLPPNTIQVYA